jgi:tRNA pseudouridine55 synthase
MTHSLAPGIHLVHKPVGPTSFSLVQSFIQSAQPAPGRRPPRICHGGTLDPFAHGLLLILVEPATRLFDYLHAIPKTYVATVRWGIETGNGDPNGQITFAGDPSNLTPELLDQTLATFLGWHDQIPHATSAKRIDGERAYAKAHRGEQVVMPPTQVYLHEARWLSHDLPNSSQLQMTVRGGYYVRALARDLGQNLTCGAHLTSLHRTQIGPWPDPGPDHTVALQGKEILPWCPTRILTDQEVGDLKKDQPIPLGELLPPDWQLPENFPDPKPPIRGFHLGKFCFLLKPQLDQLRLIAPLRGL